MKLTDIGSKSKKDKLNKVTESRFGFAIDYSSLTVDKAQKMMSTISETVNRIRHSSAIHSAEQNPKYLEMLMVYEGLDDWMHEQRMITEGEMGQAETILAAKDLVDSTQDMIERLGKMQNEQLPALVDAIRDQIGSQQADSFKAAVSQTFATLSTTLASARDQIDQAARGLTGEEAQPMDMGSAQPDFDQAPQMGQEEPNAGIPDEDTFGATDAAAGGAQSLGREMR